MQFFRISILALVLIQATQASAAKSIHCESLLEDFVTRISSLMGKRPEGMKMKIMASEPYQKYLREHAGEQNSFEQYLKKFFDRFEPNNLKAAQSRELVDQLRLHGVSSTSTDGLALLKAVSHANLEREISRNRYVPTPEMAEAEKLVQSIEPFFVHNTRGDTSEAPTLPLLSSRQLEELGTSGGANTVFFNKTFVGSDNNVFFHVKFKRRKSKNRATTSTYGDLAYVLDSEYAEQAGWISAYIMNPHELTTFADIRTPETLSLFGKLWPSTDPTQALGSEHSPEQGEVLARIRHTLYQLDFTPSDFLQLIQNHLLFRLNHLRTIDKAAFDNHLKDLKKDSQITKAVHYLALLRTPFLLTPRFELKVPVAVPPEKIEFYSSWSSKLKRIYLMAIKRIAR